MKVGITTVQIPFMRGGAELLAEGLHRALIEAGHEAEIITKLFRFGPESAVTHCMDDWRGERLADFGIDKLICLKFPAYMVDHPNKSLWLLHQHRAVYDLWETPFDGGLSQTGSGRAFRGQVIQKDSETLAGIGARFTIGRRVTERLQQYNGLTSEVLWHPPFGERLLYNKPAEPYIFAPSRLEDLKRQHLLIDAMKHVKSPVCALLAGTGGQFENLRARIEKEGLGDRVRLLGAVSDQELRALYALSLGVFFGPLDEDYGYVTLEAMLSSKPVITCHDSGGPLEFVRHGETGFVVDPQPEAVADCIEKLAQDQARAARMGQAGRQLYFQLPINWPNVVEKLLDDNKQSKRESA